MQDDDATNEPKVKKRRVTKACDQCRQRRVRCRVSQDGAPCLVCVENETAANCTFSAPTRKRGPAAGAVKSLAERVVSLERFIGHLLQADQQLLLSRADSFFHPSAELPPPDPTAQHRAFQESTLPSLFDSLPRSGSSSPPTDSSLLAYRPGSGSSLSPFDELPPHRSPGNGPPGVEKPLALRPMFKNTFGEPNYPLASTNYADHLDGLQTLASVAVDNDRKLLPVEQMYPVSLDWRDNLPPSHDSLALRPPPVQLPSQSNRDELFDLYFEQIVHLSYPMVDRDRVLDWSQSQSHASYASTLPSPGLPLAIFALMLPYASAACSRTTHSSSEFAEAGRAHLYEELSDPTVDTVQTCCILALVDWGQGEIERAWTMSAIAITLSIQLSLQGSSNSSSLDPFLRTPSPSDPHSYRIKTFHSALIIHTFLSLRTAHPPLIHLGDFSITPGPETSRSMEGLRPEYSAADGSKMPEGSTLSSMVSLCIVGVDVLRFNLRSGGLSLEEAEGQRLELVRRVRDWEVRVPPGLRADEASEMHLVGIALSMRLRSHPAFRGTYDPVIDLLHHAFSRLAYHRQSFADFHRNLPSIELALHIFTDVAFSSDDEQFTSLRRQAMSAYNDLAGILPIGRVAGGHRRQPRPTPIISRPYRSNSDHSDLSALYPPPPHPTSLLSRRRTLPTALESLIADSKGPYPPFNFDLGHLPGLGDVYSAR